MRKLSADEERAIVRRRDDEALLKRLGSRNERISRETEQEIRDRGAAGVELLAAFIERDAVRILPRRMLWVLAIPAGMVVTECLLMSLNVINLGFYAGVFYLSLVSVVFAGLCPIYVTLRRRRAALLLAETDDVRAVGPLLEVLTYPDRSLRKAAVQALTRLLPRLQVRDVPLLNPTNWRQMNDILAWPSSAQRNTGIDADFLVALIKAVATIGNAGYLPNVKDLAAGTRVAIVEPAVRAAAQECVPILVERSEWSSSKTLLRAAAPGSDILLRPAAATQDEQPRTLLRAASNSGEIDDQA